MCETPDKMHVHDIGNIATIVFENVEADVRCLKYLGSDS